MILFSLQTSHVETLHPSLTQSCMATPALKWGMSCCTFVPRGTSWATRRRRSHCSATAVGSGMGRCKPVSKVSLARGTFLSLLYLLNPCQGFTKSYLRAFHTIFLIFPTIAFFFTIECCFQLLERSLWEETSSTYLIAESDPFWNSV